MNYTNYCLNLFCNKINLSRDHKIVLKSSDDEKNVLYVNIDLNHVNRYTSFFEKKDTFIDTNEYTFDFSLESVKIFIDLIHDIFSTLTITYLSEDFFKISDYLCIDILPYIKNCINLSDISDIVLLKFTNMYDKLYNIQIFVDFLNYIYDSFYKNKILSQDLLFSINNKNALLFLLNKKWVIKDNYTNIMINTKMLEHRFLNSIINLCDKIANQQETETTFVELWNVIDYNNLNLTDIVNLSQTKYASFIRQQLVDITTKKVGLFGQLDKNYFKNRFYHYEHLEPSEIKVGDRADVLDYLGTWLTATVIERCKETHTIKVNFIGFSERFDEYIKFEEKNRMLPYKSICSYDHNSLHCNCFHCVFKIHQKKPACCCENCLEKSSKKNFL